jgi:carbamate kinase
MRILIALGGAALLDSGDRPDPEVQRRHIEAAAAAIAGIARDHQVVVTHGSGRQVGLLAVQSALYPSVDEYPLDVLGAETEGLVGYFLQQALANQLRDREVVTLLTQVVIDPADPALSAPSKLIGPPLAEIDATRLARDRGWVVAPDGGRFRRAVPSPEPLAVVELPTIERLLDAGVLVICAGGGGIPVVVDADGALRGVEAVIDKDRTAAVVATLVGADVMLLLTDVPAVVSDWGSAFARPLRHATPAQLRGFAFDAETMGPKVAAACHFVEQTGRRAAIGALPDAEQILAGAAGTQVTPDPRSPIWCEASAFGAELLPSLWAAHQKTAARRQFP